jgi:hypothetical protein
MDADLNLEMEAQRAALDAFIATAASLAPESWNAPRGSDKWSPAQVSEHLRLAYATIRSELAGQAGFRIRTKPWQRWLLRFTHLPRILRTGRFPAGVPAPREIRPAAGPYDRDQLLSALREEGELFAQAVAAAPAASAITHPFLGRLALRDGVRFSAQHIRHHHAQIAPASHADTVVR